MYQKIHLAGGFRLLEANANATSIFPGMLVALGSNGNVIPHATSGGYAERTLALEDSLQGITVTTEYLSGNPVQIAAEVPGSLTLALLTTGHSYTTGQELQSNGDGTLCPQTGGGIPLAIVVNPLALTESGETATLNEVRWL